MLTLCFAQYAVQLTYTYLKLPTHTVYGSVLLQYICTLVKLLFTLGLWEQMHCTTVLSEVLALPSILYCRTNLLMWHNPHEPCRPITGQLQFICFSLIGPLDIHHPDHLPQPFCLIPSNSPEKKFGLIKILVGKYFSWKKIWFEKICGLRTILVRKIFSQKKI